MLSGRMSGTEIRVSEMLKGHICTELDRNLEKRFQGVKAVLRSTYVEREMLASDETEPWEKKRSVRETSYLRLATTEVLYAQQRSERSMQVMMTSSKVGGMWSLWEQRKRGS
jgi:hypothetical protein